MPGFEPGDVVKAASLDTDARTTALHSAPVLACAGPAENPDPLVWALMITSAEYRGWPDDVPVDDLALAGLPAPSVVRCAKIATLDAARAETLGRLSPDTLDAVRARVGAILRFA